jgi:uncharacterized protein involved in exopolysaccharide biosynthesis
VADSPNSEVRRSARPATTRADSRSYTAQDFLILLRRRRLFLGGTLGALLLLCLIYCVVAPNQYEATARVALRMQPVSSLSLEASETLAPASILSTPL